MPSPSSPLLPLDSRIEPLLLSLSISLQKMASCRAIHRWSLRSLIGAFLDLCLAYLFLCAASLVFLASKFLSFFYLSLPCPCNGLFGHPDPAICVQSLLVDQPTARIQAVHNRVRTLSPFDGDAVSEGRELSVQLGDANEGRNRSRSSSVRGYNVNSRLTPLHIELEEVDREVELGSGSISGNSSGERELDINSDSEDSHDSSLYETKLKQEGPEIDLATTIQTLKQALEKERLARTGLTLELEKERNASSSAADEAMAMILRLQKEKSEIEIEARQYKRMTEEKSVFDLEEMEILKEIIIRREMENLALEKELEECHKLIDVTHLSGEDINGEIRQPDRDSKPDTESLDNQDINTSNSNEVLTLEGHEERDVLVYDVHVVDDEADKITEMPPVPELAKASKGKETQRGLGSRNKTATENLRRNSEPAVYIEKFKLENEVEMLRKRLKLIQKEREKLGFTVDQNKGTEASQLRILEEISRQLKEIKISTETGQSSRHVSVHHQSKAKHGR
ncbi:Myosin-binding protein 2 [Carex littledalei]|uniref:Myosin-binding protein 2 n=1 Tax=Carex littledalei TaxID=544730 RepID=A0A833VGV2_9POAL|nr:Myosin-binding protein 2 [Carex littledalei]